MGSMCRVILLMALFTPFCTIWASGPFLVTIFDDKIRVVSPDRHSPHLHATFHNRAVSKIVGKVQTLGGRVLDYINLNPGESRSISIGHIGKEAILYYPLAPAFQEVELIVGKATYEIPPQQKEN